MADTLKPISSSLRMLEKRDKRHRVFDLVSEGLETVVGGELTWALVPPIMREATLGCDGTSNHRTKILQAEVTCWRTSRGSPKPQRPAVRDC